jgi:hypothetical protein
MQIKKKIFLTFKFQYIWFKINKSWPYLAVFDNLIFTVLVFHISYVIESINQLVLIHR